MMKTNSGTLYVVATPIGHLADISLRALEILKTVNLIAAEDTRHSQRLLQHYAVSTSCLSLHEFNEQQRTSELIRRLQAGQSIALISDAGTPLISDPGYRLVYEARREGIPVTPVPGASALIAALSASGLPSDRFCFEGFLSPKRGACQKQLEALVTETRTLIFYESPHRIEETLALLQTVMGGERRVVIARELTKQFETFFSGCIGDALAWMAKDPQQRKGEFVILLAGAIVEKNADLNSEDLRILSLLRRELPAKTAAKLASEITGKSKNIFYKAVLKEREKCE